MQTSIHGPVGDKSVRVVRGAADNRIQAFLIEALAPVNIMFGLRELLGGRGKVVLVHIAQGHDVLA